MNSVSASIASKQGAKLQKQDVGGQKRYTIAGKQLLKVNARNVFSIER